MPLPFTDTTSAARLRGFDSITFDPLGVAAILGNPRADLSAARLYVQSHRHVFRWQHTTMIGGALTPVSTLVNHLAQYESVHPAVSMCTRDEKSISIISNTVFRDLRVNVGNLWLRDVLNFRPSEEPRQIRGEGPKVGRAGNDFAIASINHVFDQSALSDNSLKTFDIRWRGAIINSMGLVTGLLLGVGMVFSVLNGDIWGITLFLLYLLHWFASTLISFTCLVKPTCPEIRQDDTIKFLVHERPADIGGTVVFKGTQHELETWARTTLQFRGDVLASLLHWFWMISGTLSAISSVACMVNMTGMFQLVFLAVLFYSSVAELSITQTARYIQRELRDSAGLGSVAVLTENPTRTYAIIRTVLGAGNECSLQGLDWVGLRLLPPIPIFVEFQKMLGALACSKGTDIEAALADFRKACDPKGELPPKDALLADRIIKEVHEVQARTSKEQAALTSRAHKKQEDNGVFKI